MAAKLRTSNSSGAFFSEHSEMLALPVFYLLGCRRRADSAAGFHPAVPALAREMHLQLPLLVVHELLAHAGNLVFKRQPLHAQYKKTPVAF